MHAKARYVNEEYLKSQIPNPKSEILNSIVSSCHFL
jgi:hypothetical protein